MKRKIIEIDESKCDGCGLCTSACHEGAIGVVKGKARLLRDDFCDGLGNCLPVCPAGAITFIEREAEEYDEAAVLSHKRQMTSSSVCLGAAAQSIDRADGIATGRAIAGAEAGTEVMAGTEAGARAGAVGEGGVEAGVEAGAEGGVGTAGGGGAPVHELQNWPVQIKLASVKARYFEGANLLVAADCTAYARAGFHGEFLRGRVALIGCPKLDDMDYTEKLTQIISQNDIKSLTIVRMEVPCCGGIEQAATAALKSSGKFMPLRIVIIRINGEIASV
ncbi:MAG: 4Fe-4S binding protein [Peptococcaceae bacterium]|jgi:ferredoxin|nr:4Fe-4S binding protein [Peptococcaceae bacterium]